MYYEWTVGNEHDTIESVNMVGYIAHPLFGTLDSMSEGNWHCEVAQSYVRMHEVYW